MQSFLLHVIFIFNRKAVLLYSLYFYVLYISSPEQNSTYELLCVCYVGLVYCTSIQNC